jgi:DivIVA domain-containing protein
MPDDRRMTISSSQLSPDEVSRHTFAVGRRGFDTAEVRAYLDSLAQGLRTLAEREQELQLALDDAEHRAANPVLDEETLAAALGQETSRVLRSAHEAAAERLAKATAEAERVLSEAHEEIAATEARVSEQLAERVARVDADNAETRRSAEERSEAILDEARTQGAAILDQAREQGREMVDEAQALRARVLADLSRRRKVLHAQIEQLRAGREHLAETVHGVRNAIDAIADDLFRAEDEARLAAEAAGREVVAQPDEGTPEEVAAVLLAEEAAVADDGVEVEATPTDEHRAVEVDEAAGAVAVVEIPEAAESAETTPVAPAGVADAPATPDEAGSGEATAKPSVDDLFAKIRASTGGEEGADAPAMPVDDEAGTAGDVDVAAPPEDGDPRAARRDELIAPVVKALARRLKRTLQDDQNDLLDRLRSNHSAWSSGVLPVEPEHHDSYATAALPFLEESAEAGAAFAGARARPSVDELLGVAHELAETVVGPLRRRLADDGRLQGAEESEVAEHVGAAFREWKGERVERLAADFTVAAFSAGTLAGAAASSGVLLEWVAVAVPDGVPCPDCEDNALNGPQQPGEEFPTGHRRPPAHPGCRCLLAPPAP